MGRCSKDGKVSQRWRGSGGNVRLSHLLMIFLCNVVSFKYLYTILNLEITKGQSNLTKSTSRGAHSPVRGHPRGSKVVPLNSWGRVSY